MFGGLYGCIDGGLVGLADVCDGLVVGGVDRLEGLGGMLAFARVVEGLRFVFVRHLDRVVLEGSGGGTGAVPLPLKEACVCWGMLLSNPDALLDGPRSVVWSIGRTTAGDGKESRATDHVKGDEGR
jgi:hypothetical protein